MEKYLPATITFFIPIILFSQSLSHQINLVESNAFKVIDIQNITANYMIVTCRNDNGKTIQFLTGSTQSALGKSGILSLGKTMIAAVGSKTVSLLNDTTIKYNIVRPVFSDRCCFISVIERNRNDSVDFVIAKTDTAKGLTYFNKELLKNNSPKIILAIKQPIYQMLFNNKRYAALKSLDEREANNNIFYSYEFNFMTRKSYNALHKMRVNSNFTPRKDSIIILPVVGPSKKKSSLNVFNQTEFSDIFFGKSMATGTLQVVVPPNVEYNIKIYSLPDHTILYNSNEQLNFSLFPGIYDIEISGIIFKNIFVYKGKNTRIKTGTLSMPYNFPWVLYDANKIKKIYSSAIAKKVEFPKGIYQLEINGALHAIEIKDGEILEYDSAKHLTKSKELKIPDSKKIVQIPKQDITNSNYNKIIKNGAANQFVEGKNWEIKQNTSIKNATGRIFIKIPKEVDCIISISQPATGKEVYYSGALTNERSFSLAAGTFDVKISGSSIKNVPVQKAMETRIKAGILNVVESGIWTLYDEKKNKQIYFSPTAKKIGLPIGIYQIEINGTIKKIIIMDGETLQL